MSRKTSNPINNILHEVRALRPNKVDNTSAREAMYIRILTNLVKGQFVISCDDSWDTDYILDQLLTYGYFGVVNTVIGTLPLNCAPSGYNVFGRALTASFPNPYLESMGDVIRDKMIANYMHKDVPDNPCVLVYLYDDLMYRGVMDIIRVFASRLASCDGAIDVNIFNSKLAYVIVAKNKAQVETAKVMMDDISEGKPAVFLQSNDMLDGDGIRVETLPVKQNYIADVLQDTKTAIMNEFLTLFGIVNANTDKRERLIESEVNANNAETVFNVERINTNLQQCCKKAREVFPEIGNFNIEIKSIKDARESKEENELAEESRQNTDDYQNGAEDNYP